MRAAQAFLAISDKAKSMESQLRLATASFGSFTKAQEDSERIAKEARGGIVETTSLYSSFLRTSAELGRTQAQAATATETFSKALKLGGASTAQINSATLQMGQALASANVQWDELGQILEASPRLGKVFTDYLGKTRGELKKMAEDGKLTNQMLFDALNDSKITAGINQEFRQLSKTFDEAMQQVENASIATFAAFDRGGQFSNMLASFMNEAATGFKGMSGDAEQTGVEIRAIMEGLHDAFEPMVQGALAAFETIGLDSRSLAKQIADDLSIIGNGIDAIRNFDNGLENTIRNKIGLSGNGEGPSGFGKRFDSGADAYRRVGALRARDRQADKMFDKLLGGTPQPAQIGDWFRGEGAFAPRRARSTAAGKSGGKGKSAEQRQREAERAAEKAIRDQYQLDREALAGKRELLSAQRDLTTDYTERNVLSVQMLNLERQAREKQINLDLAMGDISKVEADRRRALEDQLTLLGKQRIWQEEELARLAGIAEVEDEAFSLRERALQGEATLAETMAERREVEMRILDLAREREQKEIDRLRLGSVEDQQRADMRQSALNGNYARDRATVMQQTRGPWESFLTSLPDTAAKANEALEGVAANGVGTLIDGLSSAGFKIKELGATFKQVSKSILADLLRIQLQKAFVGAIGNALGGLLGGLGGGLKVAPGSEFGLGNDLKSFTPNLTGLATGGTISVLGKGGLDTNLLSINGMPVARVNRGERIRVDPNATPANDRQLSVMVEKSPLFDVTVRDIAQTQATASTIEGQRTQARRARNTMGRGGR
ncbi:hypothetical protein ASE67_02655 [Sphingomonas sp. Leaf23]|nr:hypothetical protein ASE67_02655 [Sphingomonas sp. Leaf23]